MDKMTYHICKDIADAKQQIKRLRKAAKAGEGVKSAVKFMRKMIKRDMRELKERRTPYDKACKVR